MINPASGLNSSPHYNESPQPGPVKSTRLALRDAYQISTRMGRADYWWSYLVLTTVSWGLFWFANWIGSYQLEQLPANWVKFLLYYLIALGELWLIVVKWTAGLRRLHDTNLSGWYWLLRLIPVVGTIAYWILLCRPTQANGNRWPERNDQ